MIESFQAINNNEETEYHHLVGVRGKCQRQVCPVPRIGFIPQILMTLNHTEGKMTKGQVGKEREREGCRHERNVHLGDVESHCSGESWFQFLSLQTHTENVSLVTVF